MFEKYNIDELFLASINVMYPDNGDYEVNIGGILQTGTVGYGYLTILRNDGEKYIDLNNMSRKITTTIDPNSTSYIIGYMEPLNKYYAQSGMKKNTFSRRQAINVAQQYYDEVHKNHFIQMKEPVQKCKSL